MKMIEHKGGGDIKALKLHNGAIMLYLSDELGISPWAR